MELSGACLRARSTGRQPGELLLTGGRSLGAPFVLPDEQWRSAANGKRTKMAMRIAKDRDRHDRYVWIVEFPSYEEAMRNDVLQAIQQVAEALAELADGPAVFHNLDVLRRPIP